MKISASAWGGLCWYASLWGHADEVLNNACKKSVALSPEDKVHIQKAQRGFARMLAGDIKGATEDFQAYLRKSGDETWNTRIQGWIETLQRGETLNAEKIRRELRIESEQR